MDLDLFKKRIQNTALLTDERKAYYISKAEVYTPEVRGKMVEALLGQEKAFIQAETEHKREKAKENLSQMLKEEELLHQQDVVSADKLLDEIPETAHV